VPRYGPKREEQTRHVHHRRHGLKSAVVVGVKVRDHHAVDVPDAAAPKRLEFGGPARPGVDQEGVRTVLDEDRIALPHVHYSDDGAAGRRRLRA